ncbi:hypothetical protein LOTGIDRAFT_227060 [Lottia gigantea]|uniref:N(6)-L-threonylcarbamoyladenine synthase n=1 Tax=Lottia gigantea TaxID=225164 RepID=V4C494_LOTGI|nr:hypothetical protein LOTGIDRAFT_227060 [Lottia gigantea]ESO96349.1 hypothetical protein LOTGIDRAFT_227060 [Lottia gigantea]
MVHAAIKNSITFSKLRYLKQIISLQEITSTSSNKPNAPFSKTNISLNGCHCLLNQRPLSGIKNANKSKVEKCQSYRQYSNERKRYVLGIETSCDDTGAAVVDCSGNIIGESLNSQTSFHVEMGGIIPVLARDLHQANIEQVVKDAILQANMSLQDIDAIAITTEPGLAMSLEVGVQHAKELGRIYNKPVIPIHHMQAHALTVRMIQRLDFPFLVLLASGGHCLLTVAQDIDQFLNLGKHLDDSPGDTFDKVPRRLKIKNLKECQGLSGGASIELLAKRGDPNSFNNPSYLSHERNCNFSFSGMKEHFRHIIMKEEKKQGIEGGNILSNAADICASLQEGLFNHLSHRIRRGLLYTELKELLPSTNRTLVLSGGVASNMYIREKLEEVLESYDCQLICPPPKLCTDNGIMIAWNGMEKLLRGKDLIHGDEIDNIRYTPKSPIGEYIGQDVVNADIKVPSNRKKQAAKA